MKLSVSITWLAILIVICSLSSCSPSQLESSPPIAPLPEQASKPLANTLPLPTQSSPTPEAATQPTPTQADTDGQTQPSATPASAQFQGPLSVLIDNIADNMVVQADRLELNGQADPETVISFDDQIVFVGLNRAFNVSLTLEEGPNVIEITASNPAGDSATVYLSITYDPQP